MRNVVSPVIVIPADGPPTVENLPSPSYPFLRDAIGGTIDVIRILPGLDLWVADDSYGLPVNWLASAFLACAGYPPISGPAVLTAANDETGETIPLPILWAADMYVTLDAMYDSIPERV